MSKAHGITLSQVLASVLVALIFGAVFLGAFFGGAPRSKGVNCLSNLKQMDMALLVYAADSDDRLPDRDVWMNAAEFGLEKLERERSGVTQKNHYGVEFCPNLKEKVGEELHVYGYAFNSRLSRANCMKLEAPENLPMLYDSINLARNASDPLVSLPFPGRHGGKNNIAYADGHVRRLVTFDNPQANSAQR